MDGTTPVIIFRNAQEGDRSNEIVVTSASNIQLPDRAYPFMPVSDDTLGEHYVLTDYDAEDLVNHPGVVSYSPPQPSLDALKTRAKAMINKLKDRKDVNSFEFTTSNNETFRLPLSGSDDKVNIGAMKDIALMMLASTIPTDVQGFRSKDGAIYMLSPMDVVSMWLAGCQFYKDNFTWAWTKHTMIDAATTSDDIDTIVSEAQAEV